MLRLREIKSHALIEHHAINEYQLRLDVQHFLWPLY